MAEVLSSTMIIDVEDQQHSAKFLSQLRNLEKENTELREKHLCANKELEAAKLVKKSNRREFRIWNPNQVKSILLLLLLVVRFQCQ